VVEVPQLKTRYFTPSLDVLDSMLTPPTVTLSATTFVVVNVFFVKVEEVDPSSPCPFTVRVAD
jgi:hypothetical protein